MANWRLIARPHGIDRYGIFKDKGIIAIGWPNINDLSGLTKDDIKSILMQQNPQYSVGQMRNHLSTIENFCNGMDVNDLVVIAQSDGSGNVSLARITSDYLYDATAKGDGYPHQRQVEVICSFNRNDVSDGLATNIKHVRTLVHIKDEYAEELQGIAAGAPLRSAEAASCLDLEYLLAPNRVVKLSVPKDMNTVEANRLGDFCKTLYFAN